ncbi:MAG: ATP-binding protein [Anaerolineales bacterium]|nr:ATP-binding protein [Anaerolineales bacterium]
MTIQGQFKLNMDGLLEVLAGSLYSNPVVGLRELIQNAYDSCTRYSIEGHQNFQPRIDIEIKGETLMIHDNGSGLTFEEIENYLTTIGRSYTRDLKSHLELFELETSQTLIGQFGFGFLSAFMLAERVLVDTKSFQPETEPLRMTAGGGDSFIVEAGNRKTRGTSVILDVRPEASFLLEPEILSNKIRQFANFLPIPIFLNRKSEPENEMIAPWNQPEPGIAIVEFIEREFQMPPPLAIIQLHPHTEIVPHGDAIETPMHGFLFIPDSTVASVREYGDLQVYIRGMFITNMERELLPPWARFVRGLVESPSIYPTASREAIRRDENFRILREALGQQLTTALHKIQQENPLLWKQIVRGHADILTGWAVRDDSFFEQVAHILTFRTSRGQLTLPEYLALTHGKLYYVTREIKSLQEKVLAEGNSYPVIEAVWFAVRPFLEKYVAQNSGLELISLDEHPTVLFQEVSGNEFSALLTVCKTLGIPARVAAFEPAQVPALLIHPKDAEKWQELNNAVENDEIDPAILDLVSSFLNSQPQKENEIETLYLNARCSFIHELKSPSVSNTQQQIMITLLYQVARLFSGKTMTPANVIEAFSTLTHALGELIV